MGRLPPSYHSVSNSISSAYMHQHAITREAVLKLVTEDFDRRQLAIKAPSQVEDEAFVLKPERGKARSANARSNVTTATSGAI